MAYTNGVGADYSHVLPGNNAVALFIKGIWSKQEIHQPSASHEERQVQSRVQEAPQTISPNRIPAPIRDRRAFTRDDRVESKMWQDGHLAHGLVSGSGEYTPESAWSGNPQASMIPPLETHRFQDRQQRRMVRRHYLNQPPDNAQPQFRQYLPRSQVPGQSNPVATPRHRYVVGNTELGDPMGRVASQVTSDETVQARRLRNYEGRATQRRAQDLATPEHLNCSVFVTRLPAKCKVKQFLATIRHVGKIWHLHISPPTRQHPGCAATLIFFNPQAARVLVQRNSRMPLVVGGRPISIRMNDNRSGPRNAGFESRVLLIWGPPSHVNRRYLEDFLRNTLHLEWQEDGFILTTGGYENTLVWSFASCGYQAITVFCGIRERLREYVNVQFLEDPCA
jgi:hypothetical protein